MSKTELSVAIEGATRALAIMSIPQIVMAAILDRVLQSYMHESPESYQEGFRMAQDALDKWLVEDGRQHDVRQG